MSPHLERRALQIAVALAGLVPVAGGSLGVIGGEDTHVRYLSGLLLGVGLTFWSMIPTLERRGPVVRVLAAIVVVGGLARLGGAVMLDDWRPATVLPLIMELGVTPLIALWRERVERRLRG